MSTSIPPSSVGQDREEHDLLSRPGRYDLEEDLLHRGSEFSHYHIEGVAGSGGMGVVYRARDLRANNRLVALKVLHACYEDQPSRIARFQREATFTFEFRVGFCLVHEVGEFQGRHYIAMAYIQGRTLATYLGPDKEPMSQKNAAICIRKLAQSMDQAHREGFVHRDLKPENIMVSGKTLIIMDLGLARSFDDDTAPVLTKTGEVLGTAQYASPEQLESRKDLIGPATDVYSLGVIHYQLLTNQLPFQGSFPQLLLRVTMEDPPRPCTIRPEIDAGLELICLKAMARPIDARYRTMEALAEELHDWLAKYRASSPTPAPAFVGNNSPIQNDGPAIDTGPAPDLVPVGNRRRFQGNWLLIPGITLFLVFVSVVGFAVITRPNTVSDPEVPPLPSAERNRNENSEPTPKDSHADVPEPAKDTNSIGMILIHIKPGGFLMVSSLHDDERPAHWINISRAFDMGAHEVTQRQYDLITYEEPSNFKDPASKPVESVSWFGAVKFCNAMSVKEKLEPYYHIEGTGDKLEVTVPDLTNTGYRLPTEAEWEYACRAGSTTKYCFGDEVQNLEKYAWFEKHSKRMTHPVGEKIPNAFGLYDMHGNVWEWCWDWYDKSEYSHATISEDPTGPKVGSKRVLRGGSWEVKDPSYHLRSSDRYADVPSHRPWSIGFRIARNSN